MPDRILLEYQSLPWLRFDVDIALTTAIANPCCPSFDLALSKMDLDRYSRLAPILELNKSINVFSKELPWSITEEAGPFVDPDILNEVPQVKIQF